VRTLAVLLLPFAAALLGPMPAESSQGPPAWSTFWSLSG
jgi:hypothetical protein